MKTRHVDTVLFVLKSFCHGIINFSDRRVSTKHSTLSLSIYLSLPLSQIHKESRLLCIALALLLCQVFISVMTVCAYRLEI